MLELRTKLDQYIQKILPYDKCQHLIVGLLTWSIIYSSGMNIYDALIGSLVIGIVIELLQAIFPLGIPSYLDIAYTALGGLIPTIAILIRNTNV